MILPSGEEAVVDVAKLRDYVLNSLHPRGRHKARVFAAALDMHQSDAEALQRQLLSAAASCEARPGPRDQYGHRYVVDFECRNGSRRAMVRSSWIILADEGIPRLTTCFVLSE
jgi:hypothetical protein